MNTPDIQNYVHNGRALVGIQGSEGQDVMSWPQVACEAVRAINHLTGHGTPIPAPTLYTVLGELKQVGHLLPQGLRQLMQGLAVSLDTHDVYDHHGSPEDSVAAAVAALERAAALSARLGATLETAQSAIAEQGYTSAGRR